MATKVAVIGAGSWGTAAAVLACANAPTVLWARSQELADEISTDHVNRRYLPEFAVPRRMAATASLAEALTDATVVVMAVPSHGFRDVLTQGVPAIAAGRRSSV
jgi:glycerol-3-phosphate dehydrogenase (NAD(P)+)